MRRVITTIVDRGRWEANHPDTYPAHARGLGLVVMRECSAQLHIQRSPAGTTVILVSHTAPTGRRAGAAGSNWHVS